MSVTQGRTWDNGSTVASGTDTLAFQSDANLGKGSGAADGAPFKVASFDVDTGSAAPLKVNIQSIHGGRTKYYSIPIGKSKDFICVDNGAPTGHLIYVKGDGGTATFSGGITG